MALEEANKAPEQVPDDYSEDDDDDLEYNGDEDNPDLSEAESDESEDADNEEEEEEDDGRGTKFFGRNSQHRTNSIIQGNFCKSTILVFQGKSKTPSSPYKQQDC